MPFHPSNATELIDGYTLIERIGAGGYGEVWRAEAPGGLAKAVKIIFGRLDDERAACELKALNRIKEVRHPFLLSLERIEVVDGQLVIVTELAEASLKDRFDEAKKAGLPGIPRDELLVYIRDAADALDFMSEKHTLQHLDIKPENLLILGGRVKVADFGLVKDIHDATMSLMGGMTPVYASPEVFDGRPSLHSDQYSLAIVFQELLTGVLPFPGRTAAQLTAQHLTSRPRLASLPESDRSTIARALEKDPAERFPTCRDMATRLSESESAALGEATPAAKRPGGSASQVDSRTMVMGGEKRVAPPTPEISPPATTEDFPHPIPPADQELPAPPASPLRATPSPRTAATPPPRSQPAPEIEADFQWLEPPETPGRVETLGPIEVSADPAAIRPTLVIGIGGTAAKTLTRLKRRLNDRFGDMAEVPSLKILLIDTDPQTIAETTEREREGALSGRETLIMPLRQRQDYRADSDQFLRWLSRRWLYNIPRSLRTEGLRPLGRLAMVDHSEKLFARIREILAEMTAPEALAASAERSGAELRAKTPRVFVVASIAGGTGGGMVLDVAYAVQMILAAEGLAGEGVIGLLAHSTNRNPDAKDLARSSSFACLTELHHYSRASRYPGDPACDLPPEGEQGGTFDETYLVHLGDDLSEMDFEAAADNLAEYVYLDAVTAAGAFFDKCRQSSDQESQTSDTPATLRSFGLSQVGCSGGVLPSAATELLAREIAQRWRGADHEMDEPDLQLNLDLLVSQIGETAREQIGEEIKPYLQACLDQTVAGRGSDQSDAQTLTPARQIVDTINTVLGNRVVGDVDPELPPSPLRQALDARLRALVEQWDKDLCDWILRLVDTPGARLHDAQVAEQWTGNRLRAIEAEAEGRLRQLKDHLSEAEHLLLSNTKSGRLLGIIPMGSRKPKLNRRWIEFFEARLDQTLLRGTLTLLRAIRSRVAAVSDRLKVLHRELSQLANAFHPPSSLPDLVAATVPREDELFGLHRSAAELLQQRVVELAEQLEEPFYEEFFSRHGGLCGTLTKGFQLQISFVDPLKHKSRKAVFRALAEMDVVRLQFDAGGESADESADESANESAPSPLLNKATSPLLACGASQRLLLVCPNAADDASVEQALQTCAAELPSLVRDSDGDLILCREIENLSFSAAAARLIDYRADYAQIAARLHTRVDVQWSRLPPAEDNAKE